MLAKLRGMGVDPLKVPVAINCDNSKVHWKVDCIMTLTASRGAGGGFWVTCRSRRLTIPEMLRCQGMDDKTVKYDAVSPRQMGKGIGNAICQTVLEAILVQLLPTVGLVAELRRRIP